VANRRISVSYGRTCQNAPYESIRLDVRIETDITDEADLIKELNAKVLGLQ